MEAAGGSGGRGAAGGGKHWHSGYFDGKVGHVSNWPRREGVREGKGEKGEAGWLDFPVAEASVYRFDCDTFTEHTPQSEAIFVFSNSIYS